MSENAKENDTSSRAGDTFESAWERARRAYYENFKKYQAEHNRRMAEDAVYRESVERMMREMVESRFESRGSVQAD